MNINPNNVVIGNLVTLPNGSVHILRTWNVVNHDEVANKAMKELRLKYDITYGWCEDCDGLVVKQKDCCMYKVH